MKELWSQVKTTETSYDQEIEAGRDQMVEEDNEELTSPHERVKNTSACGAVLTENQLETSRRTCVHPGLWQKESHGVKQEGRRSDQHETCAPQTGHGRGGRRHKLGDPLRSEWFQLRSKRSSLGVWQARKPSTTWKIAYWLKMFPSDRPKKGLVLKIYRQLIQFVDYKKCIMWDLRVKFYLGQNEDWNLGDSTSDSCEKLLQRGRGKGQYICDFWWREKTRNQAHIFPEVFY